MELAYVVQILVALLFISLFLIVLMTSMICSSLYCTRPLWIRLHEDQELDEVSQSSSPQMTKNQSVYLERDLISCDA